MFTDSNDSLLAIADFLGVHPCCGAAIGDCRCELDETTDEAPERVAAPRVARFLPRIDESASFIDSGAL